MSYPGPFVGSVAKPAENQNLPYDSNKAVTAILEEVRQSGANNPDKLIVVVVDHVILKDAALNEKLALIVKDITADLPKKLYGCVVSLSGSAAMGVLMEGDPIEVTLLLTREHSQMAKHKGVPVNLINTELSYDMKFGNVFSVMIPSEPRIVCLHKPTQFMCELTIADSFESSCVKISCILRMNFKIRFLVIFILSWARGLKMISRDKFSRYAIVLLVVFYLQQMQDAMIPAIRLLHEENIDEAARSIRNKNSLRKLAEGFFRFYSEISLGRCVLSPYVGEKLPRTIFLGESGIPYQLQKYVEMVQKGRDALKIDTPIVIQDPYNLCKNVTQSIDDRTLADFQFSCNQALEMVMSKHLEQLLIEHIMPQEKRHNVHVDEPLRQHLVPSEVSLQQHRVMDKVPSQQRHVMDELPTQHRLMNEVPSQQHHAMDKMFSQQQLLLAAELLSRMGQVPSRQPPVMNEVLSRQPPVMNQALSRQPPVMNELLSRQPPVMNEMYSRPHPVANELLSQQHRVVDERLSRQQRVVDERLSRQHRVADEVPSRQQNVVDEVSSRQPRYVDEVPPRQLQYANDVPSLQNRYVSEIPSRQDRYVDDVVSSRRDVEDVPLSRRDVDDILPPRRRDADDILPPRRRDVDDIVPSRRHDADDLLPSRRRDADDLLPSRRRDVDDLLPSRRRDADDVLPSRRRDADDVLPSRRRDAYDELPSRRREGYDEPPSRRRDTYNELPSRKRGAYDEPPSRRRSAYDEPPSRRRDVFDEPPSRRRDAYDEPLLRRHDAYDESLSLRRDSYGERPSRHRDADDELHSRRHDMDDVMRSRRRGVDDMHSSRRHDVLAEGPSQYRYSKDAHGATSQSHSPMTTSHHPGKEANTSFKATNYLHPKYLVPETDSGIVVKREDLFQRWVNVMLVILPDFLANFVRLNLQLVHDAGPQFFWEPREKIAKATENGIPVRGGNAARKRWSCNGNPLVANWSDRKKASAELDVDPMTHPMEREALVSQHLAPTHTSKEPVSFYFTVYEEEEKERIRCYFENLDKKNETFELLVHNLMGLLPLWVQNAFEVGFSLRCVTGEYVPGNMHNDGV